MVSPCNSGEGFLPPSRLGYEHTAPVCISEQLIGTTISTTTAITSFPPTALTQRQPCSPPSTACTALLVPTKEGEQQQQGQTLFP